MATKIFKPALLVVDVQEDFSPPNGTLAVPDGRAIIPTVNELLSLPFALKVATKDWHPPDHISFADNHPNAQPYTSYIKITNPSNPLETYESRLWPRHCVQGSPGAESLPEMDSNKLDKIVYKGLDPRVEMYSAFYDPLQNPRISDSGLASTLRDGGITDCYVVGLAADYCVKSTAEDAAKEGFQTWIVEEGTRPVDLATWSQLKKEAAEKGVQVVKMHGAEVERVKRYQG